MVIKEIMKIIWEKTLHAWKFLDFKEVEILLPNWKQKIWEKVSRKWPWAVRALVEHMQNNTFIFVEQFRPAVKSRVVELVAGVIDKPGKTLEEMIAEEVREETGYIASKIEFIMWGPKSPWCSDEMSYDYYVQVSWEKQPQQLWELEDIEVIECDKKEVNLLLKSKEKSWIMVSAWIYAMLYKYFFGKNG